MGNEQVDWSKTEICQGYFFMVAIDSMMRPIPIPQYSPSTEEEISEWEMAKGIRDLMIKKKSS